MSLREIESSAADADEASDSEQQQLRAVSGGLVSIAQRTQAQVPAHALRQAQIQAQVQGQSDSHIHLTNYGHLDVTFLYNPVQYISDLATGHLGGHIAMCKLILSETPFIERWKSFRGGRTGDRHLPQANSHVDAMSFALTMESPLASPSSSRQRPQTAMNGDRTEQDAPSTSVLPVQPPSADDDAPSAYVGHSASWYKPGRLFSIWAPDDAGINEGKFLLLDTNNTEGRGILVKTLDPEELRAIVDSSTSYRNKVLLKGSGTPGSHTPSTSNAGRTMTTSQQIKAQDPALLRALEKKLLHVHMDEHAQQDVHPGTVISLNVDHNIPFVKYKCIDHGMLDGDSLEDLRFHYIQYLVNSWRLVRRSKEFYRS